MPTYEYECSKCGHAFEIFQSMTEKRLEECPQCLKNGLQRLIGSGSGIIFKGSGFYQTDYKNKSSAPKAPPKEEKGSSPCANGCANASTCPANPKNAA